MNNKGFSLIELIMVIAILVMLALLSTPNVIGLINKNKVDNYNSTIDSIVEATELYVSNNRYNLNFEDSSGNKDSCAPSDTKDIYAFITLETLVNSKNITDVTENPCNKKEILKDEISIKIIFNCQTKTFNYELYDAGDNFISDGMSKIIKIEDGKTCSDFYG